MERKHRSRFKRDLDVLDRGLEKGDLLSIQKLQDHYVLPSHYLHELIKGTRRNKFGNLRRLRYMADTGYIERPEELNPFPALAQSIWYSLGDAEHKGWKELGEKRHLYSQMPGGGYRHNAGTCIVTANIDIGASDAGFRYITQEEILRRAPERTRDAKRPLAIPTTISHTFEDGHTEPSSLPTVPDQIFGIDYGTGAIFYLLEFDRGSEPLRAKRFTTKDGQVNSILRKLLSYQQILRSGAAIKHLLSLTAGSKTPDFKVLFVTTTERRRDDMVALAAELYPYGTPNILFNWIPGFKPYNGTPPLFPHLWDGAWIRPRKEPFYLNKP